MGKMGSKRLGNHRTDLRSTGLIVHFGSPGDDDSHRPPTSIYGISAILH